MMGTRRFFFAGGMKLLAIVFVLTGLARGEDRHDSKPVSWQKQAVQYAQIMSRVNWTPVADGMPRRGGQFEMGAEYTGVPYSSVKAEGRYIGFDIFLKTFLAAVENPKSVLYTETLKGKVKNAECYYGKVCSSYTSYALQCGIWYVSRLHGPEHREGIVEVDSQSAQAALVGDVIFTPPASKTGGSQTHGIMGDILEVALGRDGVDRLHDRGSLDKGWPDHFLFALCHGAKNASRRFRRLHHQSE
ncbi:hypothetical protein N8510_03105 [bacterium]|nr:hypothetical protein [bacterium]